MILVADSGSTTTNWCMVGPDNSRFYFDTEGYNPYTTGTEYIKKSILAQLPSQVNAATASAVYFYGSGCFDDKVQVVLDALAPIFFNAQLYVGLDLLGTARAVLGNNPGFAAILGTGTNSCLYDGQKITDNIDSLGHLLGDEGSGFYMGKMLLGDFIRGYMPAAVRHEFTHTYGLTREAIMDRLYTQPLPNRFCAGFTSFLSTSRADAGYTRNIVQTAFDHFFNNLVTHYPNYAQYSFNCTGSVGYAFKDLLAETATRYNMQAGTIIKTPIEGLVEHHAKIFKQ